MRFLLTVIFVLLVIFFFMPIYWESPSTLNKAKWDSTRPKMTPIESVINTYKSHIGKYPDKLEDLIQCPTGLESVWRGPYLKESQLYDPWDRMFIYDPNRVQNGNGYLISYCKDGKPGGEKYNKDIYND